MTKYAIQVNEASEIRYHLEKACTLATTGRPGPVWVDIPLNVQSLDVNPNELVGYNDAQPVYSPSKDEIDELIYQWNKAKKPLMIVGNGIRLSNGVKQLFDVLTKTNIPVISAVNGNDLVNEDYPNYFGRFGTHAQICANKLLSECDFVLSIGTRLYVRQTGYSFKGFAKQAYKIHVDIDKAELDKPTLFTDLKIHSDASLFLENILKTNIPNTNKDWIEYCLLLKQNSPKVLQKHRDKTEYASHYAFIEELSKVMPQALS